MSKNIKKPVKITETVLRDAHQSLIATRMKTEDMLPIIEKMDKSGVEVKVEWSAIGTPTMSGMCGGKKFYFHSNNNPVAEANEFAEYYCSEDVYEYAVIGLGLAYIPQAILEMDERYKVTVIETNIEILHTAMNNIDM